MEATTGGSSAHSTAHDAFGLADGPAEGGDRWQQARDASISGGGPKMSTSMMWSNSPLHVVDAAVDPRRIQRELDRTEVMETEFYLHREYAFLSPHEVQQKIDKRLPGPGERV